MKTVLTKPNINARKYPILIVVSEWLDSTSGSSAPRRHPNADAPIQAHSGGIKSSHMEYLKSTDIGAGSTLDNSLKAIDGWNRALRNTDEYFS
jgi:hypothetical protein